MLSKFQKKYLNKKKEAGTHISSEINNLPESQSKAKTADELPHLPAFDKTVFYKF